MKDKARPIITSLIAAAAVVLAALIARGLFDGFTPKKDEPAPVLFRAAFVDEFTDEPIKGVEISLDGFSQSEVSDADGNVTIQLGPEHPLNSEIRIRTRKDGYAPWDKRVPVQREAQRFKLHPIGGRR